jgi:hypothetical protein
MRAGITAIVFIFENRIKRIVVTEFLRLQPSAALCITLLVAGRHITTIPLGWEQMDEGAAAMSVTTGKWRKNNACLAPRL